jgi:hypothetical protein
MKIKSPLLAQGMREKWGTRFPPLPAPSQNLSRIELLP